MTLMQTTDMGLRAELLRRMGDLPAIPGGGFRREGPGAFSYACVSRERLASVSMPHPVLGIVLRGTKEIWLGDRATVLPAGSVFVAPRGVLLDVLNIPDERTGVYHSLVAEIAALPPGVGPLMTEDRRGPGVTGDFAVPLTADLVHAICNARHELTDPSARAEICQYRLAEILILLRHVPQASALFSQTLAERVEWLVRGDPAHDWTAGNLGQRLGMAGSTLRRRLSQEATALREVIRRARLGAARDALSAGAGAVVAAELAGYASRSHFARHFRAEFGCLPSEFRSGLQS